MSKRTVTLHVFNCVSAEPGPSLHVVCRDGRGGGNPSVGWCRQLCTNRVRRDPAGADVLYVPVEVDAWDGSDEWAALHRRALVFDPANAAAERGYLAEMATRLCGFCRPHWDELVAKHPPDLSSADAYFAWTVDRHNDISDRIGKRAWSIDDARERWTSAQAAAARSL